MMINKTQLEGADARLDRASSAFEEIEERLKNAIARVNGVGERLTDRNVRLFGGRPEADDPRTPMALPDGAVSTIMVLLADLNFAIDRAELEIERQRDLV